MLFVLFSAGDDRYAIPSRDIDVIIPFARLKSLPCAETAFSGLLNFRGDPVPVLDMNILLGHPPVEAYFTSRIILCETAVGTDSIRTLGLLAEEMTDTRELPEHQFIEPGSVSEKARYAGRIFEDTDGSYIQWLHPERILTPQIIAALSATTDSAA